MQLIYYLIKLCTVFFLKSGGKLFSGQLLEDELSLKTFRLTDVGRCCNTTEKGQFNLIIGLDISKYCLFTFSF